MQSLVVVCNKTHYNLQSNSNFPPMKRSKCHGRMAPEANMTTKKKHTNELLYMLHVKNNQINREMQEK